MLSAVVDDIKKKDPDQMEKADVFPFPGPRELFKDKNRKNKN